MKKIVNATLVALFLAGAGTIWYQVKAQNFPLCVLYTPDNPEWYVFFCYLKAQPKTHRVEL